MIRPGENLPRAQSERPPAPVPAEGREGVLRANLLRAVEKAKILFRDSEASPLPEPTSREERISIMRHEQSKALVGKKLRALFFAMNLYGGGEVLSDVASNQKISVQDMMEAVEGSMNNPDEKNKNKKKKGSKKDEKRSS